jgi:hypothetical protein
VERGESSFDPLGRMVLEVVLEGLVPDDVRDVDLFAKEASLRKHGVQEFPSPSNEGTSGFAFILTGVPSDD